MSHRDRFAATRSLLVAPWLSAVVVAAAGVGGCGSNTSPSPNPEDRDSSDDGAAHVPVEPESVDIAANNRAVGLMGRYQYADAAALFRELVTKHPGWLDVRVNLAIATFNRQEDGDEAEGIRLLEAVLDEDPAHLRAQYCLGVLKNRDGREDAAREHFGVVVEGDPDDGYAAFFYAQCLESSDPAQAIEWYERALEHEPYLRSAYYRLASVLRMTGELERAETLLDAFSRLDGNPQARTIKTIYTRMGPKAECIAIDRGGVDLVPPKPGPVFLPPCALVEGMTWTVGDATPSIAAADFDHDGDLDLLITRVLDGDAFNAVLRNDGRGGFAVERDHVFAAIPAINAVLWGDYDNDGRVDVYFCRDGANQLWRQDETGAFHDVSADAGVIGDRHRTRDGAFFDADHDGDLDLFCANGDGPNELFSNNGDGTFRALAADAGLTGTGAARQVVVEDFDASRDLDILVINDVPPHDLYLNDRLWSYRRATDFAAGVQAAAVTHAASADLDADGMPEIVTTSAAGRQIWSRDHDGAWRSSEAAANSGADASALAIFDARGAGVLACLTDAQLGAGTELRTWTPVALIPSRGPSVIAVTDAGDLVRLDPGPGRHPFLALDLRGRVDVGKEMRSNAAGIGTRVAVRRGSTWTVARRLRTTSAPGQHLQPLLIGLGDDANAAMLSIDWPDGTFQSEVHGVGDANQDPVALASGGVETVVETQRQVSSCPVVFAWDGRRMRFVSDVLGVGGMGYLVEPGTYAPPRPHERFALPADAILPRDGAYEFCLLEPMEEACYLDAVGVDVYDLPPGWELVLDERMAISGPVPTGDALFYRTVRAPTAATNDRGADVLAAIAQRDDVAAPVGALDHRFIGRLVNDHVLDVHFDAPLDTLPGAPVLVIDGWVEYPYSQTMFAAWQAGAAYRAFSLDAWADGAWQRVATEFGYPAGMPREMALPLPKLPAGTTALRLTTNQEVYIDRVRVVGAEPCPEAIVRRMPLESATVESFGFPQRTTLAQRRPAYDFDERQPFWDTRHQAGLYTAFGDALPLVTEREGGLAIFGPGEGIRLRATAPAGEPPRGWRRRVVLDLAGWCKDMDLFTHDGETLAPLPEPDGGTTAAGAALNHRMNHRHEAGH